MNDNDRLRRYLDLCRRLYERMRRGGSWPWMAIRRGRGTMDDAVEDVAQRDEPEQNA